MVLGLSLENCWEHPVGGAAHIQFRRLYDIDFLTVESQFHNLLPFSFYWDGAASAAKTLLIEVTAGCFDAKLLRN